MAEATTTTGAADVSATATAATTTATTDATTQAATPAAFDWKTSGLDEASLAFVGERQWRDPASLLGSYRNLEKLTGRLDAIISVPKDDNPEAWGAVYDRLGRPKAAAEYKLPVPEGDKGEFAGVAGNWFHELGLNTRQAQGIATKWNEHVANITKAETEATQLRDREQVDGLKKDWGSNYDAFSAQVDAAAATFGMTTEQLTALKNAMGPGAAMKFMQSIGSKLGVEGEFHASEGKGGGDALLTPEQAQAKLRELRGDRTFSERFNASDPAIRAEARREMDRLNRMAYPGTMAVG